MGDLKATPGPWAVSKNSSGRRVTSATGIVICNAVLRNTGRADRGIKYGCKELKEAEANANLIAAAPELYEAALPFKAKLNEAIESFGAAEYALGGPLTDDDAVTVTIGQLRAISAALAKARGEHPQSIREGVDRD